MRVTPLSALAPVRPADSVRFMESLPKPKLVNVMNSMRFHAAALTCAALLTSFGFVTDALRAQAIDDPDLQISAPRETGVVDLVQAETGLSFLGFGINPPDTSLGVLIREGSGTLLTAPWMFMEPAALLLALCLSMTLIGDGLRDALDPSSASGGRA